MALIIKGFQFKNRLFGEKTAKMTVIEAKTLENSYYLLLQHQNLKYQLYSDQYYEVGDVLLVKGTFIDLDKDHVPGLFNYYEYAKRIGIGGRIIDAKIVKIKKRIVWSSFHDVVLKYYDRNYSKQSAAYLKALVIGDKSSLDIMREINVLGISHLFVVSGLHVTIILGITQTLITKIIKKESLQTILTLGILAVYVVMTNFLISVIRVVIGYVLKKLNQRFNLKLSPLDILSIETIIPVLINPYFIFNSSFILSYGLTYSLVIGSKLLKSKNYFSSLIKMTMYCQIISLPLAYNFSNEFNLLSIFFNLFFVPFVTYIFLPMAIIISFLPFLDFLFEKVISLFELIVNFSTDISIYINFPKVSIIYILLFLVIIYLLFKMLEERKVKKVLVMVLIIYISIWLNIGKLNIYDRIVFFNLPNGEATLIRQAFNQVNILIDTGDITEENQNTIVQYLKKEGISTLDYVFITHSDSDHIGGLPIIMKKIKVKNIMTNCYEDQNLFNLFYQLNNNLHIYYLKKGMNFYIKDIYIKVYSPDKSFGDINNNSLVFSVNIDGFKVLFTGDIESPAEQALKIEQENYDLLKIAHHGSKTSTSLNFLEKINFKTAIIMNGYHNIFDFPSSVVTNRLKTHEYYITSTYQTIVYQKAFFKKKYKLI